MAYMGMACTGTAYVVMVDLVKSAQHAAKLLFFVFIFEVYSRGLYGHGLYSHGVGMTDIVMAAKLCHHARQGQGETALPMSATRGSGSEVITTSVIAI